jgi:hypothetical protein
VFVAETNAANELRVAERSVIPAAAVGAMIGVASGVQIGDRVVKEGSFKLQDGALIAEADLSTSVTGEADSAGASAASVDGPAADTAKAAETGGGG